MKKIIIKSIWALLALVLLLDIFQNKRKIKNLEFQHSRDSLVIDTLKKQNAIGGWYESQWSKETGD
jgi:hypothetical protein